MNKSRSEYEHRYDRHTVDICRKLENYYQEACKKEPSKRKIYRLCHELELYFRKGNRYRNRRSTIDGWIEHDREIEEKLATAKLPYPVQCRFCSNEMRNMDKFWEFKGKSNKIVVYFYLACKDCQVYCQVWESGKRKDRIPWQCPDCQCKMEMETTRKGSALKTCKKCTHCGYKNAYTLDLSEDLSLEIEKDENWVEDMARFCLNDEEGFKFLREEEALKSLGEKMKKIETKGKEKQEYNESPKMCWHASDGTRIKL